MFTGIVEMKGALLEKREHRLVIRGSRDIAGLERGESIAVNGCCLTLESWNGADLTFHVLSETFSRTNLGMLKTGAMVNLERAMPLGGRMGGHLVTGHVDAVAQVVHWLHGEDEELTVEFPPELAPYFVMKGSVAIDGVSLTVAGLKDRCLKVCLIPVTLADTALADRKKGDFVNIETDLAGKYVLRNLELQREKESSVSMETLEKAGFL